MVRRLNAAITQNEQNIISGSSDGYTRSNASAQASRKRDLVPKWVDALFTGTVRLKKPKVLKAKAQYKDSLVVVENGLYVAVQAYLHTGEGRSKIMGLHEVQGYGADGFPVPCLNMSFYLDHKESELVASDHELVSQITFLSRRLSDPVIQAYQDMSSCASEMVKSFREGDDKAVGLLVEKLGPHLDGNPLVALSPESLSLIFRTPWSELDRLVSFVKGNRVLAGGADPDTVEYLLRLIVAKKVMDT